MKAEIVFAEKNGPYHSRFGHDTYSWCGRNTQYWYVDRRRSLSQVINKDRFCNLCRRNFLPQDTKQVSKPFK